MNNLKPVRLSELKTQASFLLKELRNISNFSRKSPSRFLTIPCFSQKTEQWIIEHVHAVQLKHAYTVIALENGFNNWADLKHAVIENDCLYKPCCISFIYAWFSNYEQAEVYFQKNGGYLIVFWKDFVVCGKEYIDCLGLSQHDEKWKSLGYNWVNPKNKEAFQFLKEAAKNNYQI